jgi:hypothetical protein
MNTPIIKIETFSLHLGLNIIFNVKFNSTSLENSK